MEHSSTSSSLNNIEALPTELKLFICEYLPADTLRCLSELSKNWKSLLNTFYIKGRHLSIDSYKNTLWALSRFRRIESISLRAGYTPSDNILVAIATSSSCNMLRRADFSVPKYSLNVPVVNHGLRALAESASCSTLESLNLNVSTHKNCNTTQCAFIYPACIDFSANNASLACIRSFLCSADQIQPLNFVASKFSWQYRG